MPDKVTKKKAPKLLFKSHGGGSVLDFILFYLIGGKNHLTFLKVPVSSGEKSKLHLLEKDCKVESLAFMVKPHNQPH